MDKKIKDAELVLKKLNEDPSSWFALAEGLHYIRSVQSVTSDLIRGCMPEDGAPPSPDQIRTYFLALMIEISELVQELNWKPWKIEKSLDKPRVADEFADILAFLGVIIEYLNRLGISPESLASAYNMKVTINVARALGQVEGYNGNGQG